jgi:hypothetical protein
MKSDRRRLARSASPSGAASMSFTRSKVAGSQAWQLLYRTLFAPSIG